MFIFPQFKLILLVDLIKCIGSHWQRCRWWITIDCAHSEYYKQSLWISVHDIVHLTGFSGFQHLCKQFHCLFTHPYLPCYAWRGPILAIKCLLCWHLMLGQIFCFIFIIFSLIYVPLASYIYSDISHMFYSNFLQKESDIRRFHLAFATLRGLK